MMLESGIHVMIDLETMSLKPNAAIVSIGAVIFDDVGYNNSFYTSIDPDIYTVLPSFDIDASTLLWWLKQSPEAIKEAFTSPSAEKSARNACVKFVNWWDVNLPPEKTVYIWAQGITFDGIVLEHFLKRFDLVPANWSRYNFRDLRTLRNYSPEVSLAEKNEMKHNALSDAKYQVKILLEIFRRSKHKKEGE